MGTSLRLVVMQRRSHLPMLQCAPSLKPLPCHQHACNTHHSYASANPDAPRVSSAASIESACRCAGWVLYNPTVSAHAASDATAGGRRGDAGARDGACGPHNRPHPGPPCAAHLRRRRRREFLRVSPCNCVPLTNSKHQAAYCARCHPAVLAVEVTRHCVCRHIALCNASFRDVAA
jgi:hypothetical protein